MRFPTIDIESIGAGGGSIAWIDEGGGVHIGPKSAGADPGPVCYGRGGTEPTVTDCNLMLGHLARDSFLGGDFALDYDAAHRAIEAKLARPLGKTVIEAAEIVRAVANALMAQAIRLMTVERGYDPRDFVYIPYGGAGPVHAMDLVRELEIPTVIVPPLPGLFSAFGMLVADLLHDLQAPILRNLDEITAAELTEKFGALETEARALMRQAGVPERDVALRRRADCRYLAQAESLSIALPDGPISPETIARLIADFTAEHQRQWNFIQPERPVTLVNIRIQAVGKIGSSARGIAASPTKAAAPIGERRIHLAGAARTIPCYARDQFAVGQAIAGPAVIQEHSSSIVLDPGDRARLDPDGNIVIQAGGGS